VRITLGATPFTLESHATFGVLRFALEGLPFTPSCLRSTLRVLRFALATLL
jgi:hypothetical protein